jgi:hypothetical protein
MQLPDQINCTRLWRRCYRPSLSTCPRPDRPRSKFASFVDCRPNLLAALLLIALPHTAGAQVDSAATSLESGPIILSNITGSAANRGTYDPVVEPETSSGRANLVVQVDAKEQPASQVTQEVDLRRLIARVATEYRVGADLIAAVAAAESRFDPTALSPRGAQGLMQLMPATAKRFGVRDVWKVEDNLRGGAAYLRWLLDLFGGDTTLAVAAYNAGEQAVLKAGRRIPAFAETRNYVPRVLAWREQYAAQFKQAEPAGPAIGASSRPAVASQGAVPRRQAGQAATPGTAGMVLAGR